MAARNVSYRRVRSAIVSFVSYKFPSMDGIFPTLLQEGREIILPYLVRIFRSCLAAGYVALLWRQVKVMCKPKLAKICYFGSRDFRPISLTSFLFKVMGTLLDTFVRDEILELHLIHPKQHVYQAGKYVETGLHRLVVQGKKPLELQDVALVVFLVREGLLLTPLTNPCV